jgi:uncharacterized protein YycO
MGQQQLLLLVLATVIVGLATVAGIQAFEQGSTRAEADALTQTAVKIASDVQAKTEEPSQFGGYDGDLSSASASSDGITLEEMGYETSSGVYSTADGDCAILSGGSNATLTANSSISASSGTNDISVICESEDVEIIADVTSLDSDGISTKQAIDSSTDLSS